MELSNEEIEAICFSLNMWKNYIETGNVNLFAVDKNKHKIIKGLELNQLKKDSLVRSIKSKVRKREKI
jgi:hypothetical protein